jgi:hypothetical protein
MDSRKLKIKLPGYSAPLLLLLLSLLAFGLLIRNLGFYWDDWPAAWYKYMLGSSGFRQVFAADRPLQGWLYTLTTPIMGISPLRWHIFALFARWLCAVAFWITAWSIWPKHLWQATLAALLFLVYPGFSQQPIAITYSHAWLMMGIFFASLIAMVWAYRLPRWFWPLSMLGWLLAALTLFTVEYFFGLELLRPVILWLILATITPDRGARLKKTFLGWVPYLIISVIFLFWRLFLTNTPRGQVTITSQLASNPTAAVTQLFQTIFSDIYQSSITAWGQITQFSDWFSASSSSSLAPILLILTVGVLTGLFLWFYTPRLNSNDRGNLGKSWGTEASLLGLFALLVGGIPFWMTDLPIELGFPWDRFTLSMIFGASLLIVGLLDLLIHNRTAQIAIVSTLVGLAVGWNYVNTDFYQRRWLVEKNFFWQLVWRAPQIKPGTVLLSDSWPFTLFTDNSLAAPLNWTYAPDNHDLQMPYMFMDISSRLGLTLPALEPNLPINVDYRATYFEGNTSQALVFFFDPPACLRILDPRIDQNVYRYPNTLYEALPLSKLDLIETEPATKARPPARYFGSDVPAQWCYYYEKADLALQSGDYQAAADLGEQAFAEKMTPFSPYEFFPLIEANAHLGKWSRSVELTHRALARDYKARPGLCALWALIDQDTQDSPEKQAALTESAGFLKCTAP